MEIAVYRLAQGTVDNLLLQSETGMGFQRVTAGNDQFVVLNATWALCADESWHVMQDEVDCVFGHIGHADENGELERKDCWSNWFGHIEDLELNEFVVDAGGSYATATSPKERFCRVSAFRPDLRIAANGSLLAGSYATTLNDSQLITSGLGAVGRYALPSPAPAVYLYEIRPPQQTHILCGTVHPNFGQAGGGVEVRFPHGTPPGTVSYKRLLPDR